MVEETEKDGRQGQGKHDQNESAGRPVERLRHSKRRAASVQECETGPSKRVRIDAGPSASTSDGEVVQTTEAKETETDELTCPKCKATFTAKNTRDRHAESHEADRVVYVCRGRRSESYYLSLNTNSSDPSPYPEPNGRYSGIRCLKPYSRADAFRRHIFKEGTKERKGNCHEEPTPMRKSEYEELCRKMNYTDKRP